MSVLGGGWRPWDRCPACLRRRIRTHRGPFAKVVYCDHCHWRATAPKPATEASHG